LFILIFNEIFDLPLPSGSELIGYADDVSYYKQYSSVQDTKDINSDLELLCIGSKTVVIGWIWAR